jgi:thiamine-monophosphate kinase
VETEFVDWLRRRVTSSPSVPTGIGDDAAVIEVPNGVAVVTSDMLMDGTDFEMERCDRRRVGRKALAVNLSDLAAMAARPAAAIVSLAIPARDGLEIAKEVYEGLLELAAEYHVPIAGGDTNSWSGPFAVSITLLGNPTGRGPVRRSGAQVGDHLLVTGEFGGSILGRHFDFTPRVEEAIWIHENEELHAAIDVSDGLSLDLSRLVSASTCGAEIGTDLIPVSNAAKQLSANDGVSPLDHALCDGEDFELVLAVPPATAERLLAAQPLDVPLTRIGRLVSNPGLWQSTQGKTPVPLPARGYEH